MAGVKGKSGRTPNKLGLYWREACRDIATSDKVLKLVKAAAESDPVFALRVAEHGFGRPFQAVHVKGRLDHEHTQIRTVELQDGNAAFAETPGLPAKGIN